MTVLARILAWRKSMFAQMVVLTSIFLAWGVYTFVIRPLADIPAAAQRPAPLVATREKLRQTLNDVILSSRTSPAQTREIANDPFLRQIEARNPGFRYYVRVGDRAYGNGPPVYYARFGYAALERVHRALRDPTLCSQGERIVPNDGAEDFATFRMCDTLSRPLKKACAKSAWRMAGDAGHRGYAAYQAAAACRASN